MSDRLWSLLADRVERSGPQAIHIRQMRDRLAQAPLSRVLDNLQRSVPQSRPQPTVPGFTFALAQWEVRTYLIDHGHLTPEEASRVVAYVVAHGLNPNGWPAGSPTDEARETVRTALWKLPATAGIAAQPELS